MQWNVSMKTAVLKLCQAGRSALSEWRRVLVEALEDDLPQGGSLFRQQCIWWKHKTRDHYQHMALLYHIMANSPMYCIMIFVYRTIL
jgi:hypothetical protein